MSDEHAGIHAYAAAVVEADARYQTRLLEINEQLADAVRARDAAKQAAYDEWMRWEAALAEAGGSRG